MMTRKGRTMETETTGIGQPTPLQPTPLLEALNEFSRTGDPGPAIAALKDAGYVEMPPCVAYRPARKGEMFMEFRGPSATIVTRQLGPGKAAEFSLITFASPQR